MSRALHGREIFSTVERFEDVARAGGTHPRPPGALVGTQAVIIATAIRIRPRRDALDPAMN